ncbi:hypothetical protein KY290_027946 [Solanum tuberosum]|uniref:Uncharacterized protein n=1 Tax=Solanum tuberosum TaxID=4113 RepID=A0ABQ7UGY7_SOLTU|nr:hypothetical protein KY290_027946 [Solanum tuberosum]
MDSGDGSSVPKRKTRQQFLKYCVAFIEKRNKSTQNGNTTHSFTTCYVNIEEDDHVSCGRKIIKLEDKNTSFGEGEKPKMGKWSEDASLVRSLEKGKKKVDSCKRKFNPGTSESIAKRPFIQGISDSDGDDNDDDLESDLDTC